MMKYKIALFGKGGQYTFGAVTTASDIDAIHNAIDNGTVSSAIERDGDWELENNDLDNMLIEAYGPEKDETKITVISFSSNIDDLELVYMNEDNGGEIIVDDDINETSVSTICVDPEWYKPDVWKEFPEETLFWGNEKQEKRINYISILTLPDNEKFSLNNLFVIYQNMEELINPVCISYDLLYITEDQRKKFVKDNYNTEVTDNDLLSTFEDLLIDYNELSEKFSKFLLEPILVEGKGEWENDVNIILTKENDLVYED